MKTVYIAAALALLGGSAAHAETILDAFIGSDARVKVEDCGTDTCGTITLGKQKFVVKKSDISSALKDLDIGDVLSSTKPPAKQHGKSPAFDKADPYSLRLANTSMVIGNPPPATFTGSEENPAAPVFAASIREPFSGN